MSGMTDGINEVHIVTRSRKSISFDGYKTKIAAAEAMLRNSARSGGFTEENKISTIKDLMQVRSYIDKLIAEVNDE